MKTLLTFLLLLPTLLFSQEAGIRYQTPQTWGFTNNGAGIFYGISTNTVTIDNFGTRFHAWNSTRGSNQYGTIIVKDYGVAYNNLEHIADSGVNLRFTVLDRTNNHVGFNLGGTTASAFVVRIDTTDGRPFIGIRGTNYEAGGSLTDEGRIRKLPTALRIDTEEGGISLRPSTGFTAVNMDNDVASSAPLSIGANPASGEAMVISFGNKTATNYHHRIYSGMNGSVAESNYIRFDPTAPGGGNVEAARFTATPSAEFSGTVTAPSLTVTNLISLRTNYVSANFTPVAGYALIVPSNNVIYCVTQTKTNVMVNNEP